MEKGTHSTIYVVVDSTSLMGRFNVTNGPAYTTRKDAENHVRDVRLANLKAEDVRISQDEFCNKAWEYKVLASWAGNIRIEMITLFDVNQGCTSSKSK